MLDDVADTDDADEFAVGKREQMAQSSCRAASNGLRRREAADFTSQTSS